MAKSLISDPIWPPQNFFMVFFSTSNRKRLSFYVISRKTKEPHLTKWQKKPNFRSYFGSIGPSLSLKIFLQVFTSNRCYTLLQAIIVCNFKES